MLTFPGVVTHCSSPRIVFAHIDDCRIIAWWWKRSLVFAALPANDPWRRNISATNRRCAIVRATPIALACHFMVGIAHNKYRATPFRILWVRKSTIECDYTPGPLAAVVHERNALTARVCSIAGVAPATCASPFVGGLGNINRIAHADRGCAWPTVHAPGSFVPFVVHSAQSHEASSRAYEPFGPARCPGYCRGQRAVLFRTTILR
eukprot:SAG31_NODE_3591_length_4091_cov_3.159068_3_plen_206_part_00